MPYIIFRFLLTALRFIFRSSSLLVSFSSRSVHLDKLTLNICVDTNVDSFAFRIGDFPEFLILGYISVETRLYIHKKVTSSSMFVFMEIIFVLCKILNWNTIIQINVVELNDLLRGRSSWKRNSSYPSIIHAPIQLLDCMWVNALCRQCAVGATVRQEGSGWKSIKDVGWCDPLN